MTEMMMVEEEKGEGEGDGRDGRDGRDGGGGGGGGSGGRVEVEVRRRTCSDACLPFFSFSGNGTLLFLFLRQEPHSVLALSQG